MSDDPYSYPDTATLRNHFGIHEADALERIERDVTYAALAELGVRRVPGRYDLAHLRLFHMRIFGDIYPWAGEVRTVGIAKSDSFCLPQFIESYAGEVFGALAGERYLDGLSRPAFVDRATHFFGEVNAIHPFREGNGRAQRAFFGQLSRDAGHPIDWSALDRDRNMLASAASLRGDNGPLKVMLDSLVAL